MFKSIQWKMLTVFILLTVSVMLAVGTFLLNGVSSYYHNEFKNQMETLVFTDDFVNQLKKTVDENDTVSAMQRLIDIYAGRIGIDSYRNCCVLTKNTAEVLYSFNGDAAGQTELTQNLMTAMRGGIGNAVNRRARLMDYAYPIEGNSASYIIYVSDTKEELYEVLRSLFTIIFWALFVGLVISVLLGLFLSRTITAPIALLKSRAEKIAAGDFDQRLEIRSRDEIGQLTGTFNQMASELSATLSEIAREKTKVETILRFMTDAIIAFYSGGGVMHINPAARSLLGIESDDLMFDEFFSSLGADIRIEELLYLEHYKTVERDIEYKGKTLKAHFAPFATDGAAADGVVVVIQDITEQQRLDNARREFVANVSHELRTPLTTVKSYTETLAENAEPNSMEANFLKVIESEADRMTRLVKDLLTLSLLDYDKKALNKASFSMQELVRSIVQRLNMDIKAHGHRLKLHCDDSMRPLFGDRDRLEQVITNIITNAIKYTPDGGTISVSCISEPRCAVISVTDNGIGIPQNDIPRLFDRFYRVDKARSRKYGGTGLGLAIAKEIVDAHGGTISVESAPGQGTRVTVSIPFYSK